MRPMSFKQAFDRVLLIVAVTAGLIGVLIGWIGWLAWR